MGMPMPGPGIMGMPPGASAEASTAAAGEVAAPASPCRIVMPGVHAGAVVEVELHVAPTLPPVEAQLDPLQHKLALGAELCGVQVRPGAQPPVESQRHPW